MTEEQFKFVKEASKAILICLAGIGGLLFLILIKL
jgi:hypothetical protein